MAPKRKSDAVAVDKEPSGAALSAKATNKPLSSSSATRSSTRRAASATDDSAAKPAGAAAPASKKAKTEESKKAGAIKKGGTLDDVSLKTETGDEVALSELWAEKGLVLFSYPKASTPGCTTQACNYRDIWAEFDKAGWQVWGISCDTPNAQQKFKEKHSFGYSLLCDPSKALLKQLGWTDGQKRNHWVIGKGGVLLEAALGVKPKDDAQNALDFVKNQNDA